MKIGVIALQGDVSEHVRAMEKALEGKGSVIEVRRSGLVPGCDGLILPGGESTTISMQLQSTGIRDEIIEAVGKGVPLLATCAGLVLVSKKIDGDSKVEPLGLMDITIGRNVFGSQRDSFEADLPVAGFDEPYRAVFIRAPAIVDAEKGVEILARIDADVIVAARQGNIMCLAFHPELTSDMRFHKKFINMVGGV